MPCNCATGRARQQQAFVGEALRSQPPRIPARCVFVSAVQHAQQKAADKRTTLTEVIDSSQVSYELDGAGAWQRVATPTAKSSRRLLDRLQGTFLPSGYPDTISPDYLPYQLWTLPTHITGWIGSSLVTSSLLSAAGLGTGAAGTVAAGASIRWILKDGIGALGRYIVGGSLARFFDEDPRFWRFLADLVVAVGFALEIGTAASPGLFLFLAGTGNFAKAAGKGVGRPSFRVIQNHFALGSNVGDVAAKEEVWEVTAQLVGLALSVAVLQLLEMQDTKSAALIVGAWSAAQGAHIAFRWKALSLLQLPWISQRRGITLAEAFVAGSPLPGVSQLCQEEPFVLPKALMRCSALANASIPQLDDAARKYELAHGLSDASAQNATSRNGSQAQADSSDAAQPSDDLSALLDLFADQQYVLAPASSDAAVQRGPVDSVRALLDFKPRFVLAWKDGVSSRDKLQALLQMSAHQQHIQDRAHQDSDVASARLEAATLQQSLQYAGQHLDDFTQQLRDAGWRADDVIAWSGQNNVLIQK